MKDWQDGYTTGKQGREQGKSPIDFGLDHNGMRGASGTPRSFPHYLRPWEAGYLSGYKGCADCESGSPDIPPHDCPILGLSGVEIYK